MVIDNELKKLKFVPNALLPAGNILLSLFTLKDDGEIEVKRLDGAILVLPRKRDNKTTILIYFHGGAYVYKAAPYHYRNVREYVVKANVAVLMVDYPLSPRNKYPEAVAKGVEWYEKFSSCPLAVAGDSAGGEIALSVVMATIERKLPLPLFLMLLYPVVSPIETESKRKYTSTLVWNTRLNKKMWRLYLGKEEYRSVFDFPEISSFPPTYIESAEFDPLSDEAEILFDKLSSSGVECDYYKVPGTPHGYDMIRKAHIVDSAFKRRIDYLVKRSEQ